MPVNRILTDEDRANYEFIIQYMYRVLPMSGHKIADAMVQEAFVYATASYDYLEVSNNILSAGSYHDVAAELLRYNGFSVYDVDPVINYDLHTFIKVSGLSEIYDGIISTSVLEHTVDDVEFITDICKLLKPGGYGIMTMDFKDDWIQGQAVPYTSNRFYTQQSLNNLRAVLQQNNCDLVDEPDWTGKDRFVWDGINYSFATFVFQKKG